LLSGREKFRIGEGNRQKKSVDVKQLAKLAPLYKIAYEKEKKFI